ncbi:hypothetical protein JTE90_004027 [Oedothorax gibbosus]|uniref:Uncharacterized protein n=1 Tax=Oedothorax gibbosus TaxID=931172 RepID=A0AAV6U6D6_9ARAC|nr:hypothetical protein JTE90_004027 [Oedothorax gibbosus]
MLNGVHSLAVQPQANFTLKNSSTQSTKSARASTIQGCTTVGRGHRSRLGKEQLNQKITAKKTSETEIRVAGRSKC